VTFRGQNFANPAGLVSFIGEQGNLAKIRPDQSIVFIRDWRDEEKRLTGAAVLMTKLANLSEQASQKAA
ncbi:MAG: hypothetical protein AAF940_08665, partial [Pseudomonadota bacterium]